MFLFLDESGTDHKTTPYEVIGGIALPQRHLWQYVVALKDAQRSRFGGVLHDLAPGFETKGSSLLSRDKFRKAAWRRSYTDDERRSLCCDLFHKNARGLAAEASELAALGQACLGYASDVLRLALQYEAKVFASIVSHSAPQPASSIHLRRDLSFLFERYFYYLDSLPADTRGLIVFDDIDAQCFRRLRQVDRYFLRTQRGQEWSRRIIPEPFFVRSGLTTGVQAADLVIYILNWAHRFGNMDGEVRAELAPYMEQVRQMICRTTRPDGQGIQREVWSVTYLDELRPVSERQ